MVYGFSRFVVSLLVKPWRGKVLGLENLPRKGGVILAANHASYLDHIIIMLTIVERTGRQAYFIAKKEHFDTPLQRIWHTHFKAIPIDREGGGKEGLQKATKLLQKGNFIMIYPEGTRTLTGKLNKAKTGVARLALDCKVAIVPIGITNTFKILPKGVHFPRFGKKADLIMGKPISFENYYGKEKSAKVLRKLTTKVMIEIAKLLKTSYDYTK